MVEGCRHVSGRDRRTFGHNQTFLLPEQSRWTQMPSEIAGQLGDGLVIRGQAAIVFAP